VGYTVISASLAMTLHIISPFFPLKSTKEREGLVPPSLGNCSFFLILLFSFVFLSTPVSHRDFCCPRIAKIGCTSSPSLPCGCWPNNRRKGYTLKESLPQRPLPPVWETSLFFLSPFPPRYGGCGYTLKLDRGSSAPDSTFYSTITMHTDACLPCERLLAFRSS
jgi:hypothetical protein